MQSSELGLHCLCTCIVQGCCTGYLGILAAYNQAPVCRYLFVPRSEHHSHRFWYSLNTPARVCESKSHHLTFFNAVPCTQQPSLSCGADMSDRACPIKWACDSQPARASLFG